MNSFDRRSGDDRRRHDRYSVNIDIEWEGLGGKKTGTISDISLSGCFVLSSGEVEDREKIKIQLFLSDGAKIQFSGEIVNHVFEIGFGIRFAELTEPQRKFLRTLTESLKKTQLK